MSKSTHNELNNIIKGNLRLTETARKNNYDKLKKDF